MKSPITDASDIQTLCATLVRPSWVAKGLTFPWSGSATVSAGSSDLSLNHNCGRVSIVVSGLDEYVGAVKSCLEILVLNGISRGGRGQADCLLQDSRKLLSICLLKSPFLCLLSSM